MILRAEDLVVGYGSEPVIGELSFELAGGQVLVVIGHNGSGKTTLLRTLVGLLRPLRGDAQVLGVPLTKSSNQSLLAAGVRYLGQGVRSFDQLTIRQQRRVLADLYGFRSNEPPPFDSADAEIMEGEVGKLSVGKRRLEAINLLAVGKPKLFLLDEPTAGLDPTYMEILHTWIRKRKGDGVSFIIVEHNFGDFLEYADQAMVFRSGVVSFKGAASLLREASMLELHYL